VQGAGIGVIVAGCNPEICHAWHIALLRLGMYVMGLLVCTGLLCFHERTQVWPVAVNEAIIRAKEDSEEADPETRN
jgi:hypothetical protein